MDVAIKVEYDAQMNNKTWVLSTLPLGKKAIGCKWIFNVKYKLDGSLDKYNSCIVSKGYPQDEGLDYEETFVLTMKNGNFSTSYLHFYSFWMEDIQMDVKSALM